MQDYQSPGKSGNLPKRTVKDYLNMFYLLTGNPKIYELAPLFEAKNSSSYNMLQKIYQLGYIDDKKYEVLKSLPLENFKDSIFRRTSDFIGGVKENKGAKYKISEEDIIKVINFVKLLKDDDKK